MGVWFRVRTELCARKEDFGSVENRSVCAEDGYSMTIIYVFNVGMIRVYRLKYDSLEMFSVCECNDVLQVYLYVGLSATSQEINKPC